MAAQLLDEAYKQLGVAEPRCATTERPLPGAAGLLAKRKGVEPVLSVALALQALGIPAIDRQVAMHWAHSYGVRALAMGQRLSDQAGGAGDQSGSTERLDPELPYLYAEVDLAVAEDSALRLDDVLARRLPVLIRARDQGLGCAERVAARMAPLLQWSDAETAAEIEHYRDVVALSRQYQVAPPSTD